MRNVGHSIERIKKAFESSSLEEVNRPDKDLDFQSLFSNKTTPEAVRTCEAVELATKDEINRYCGILYDLIGPVDRAWKRYLWLDKCKQKLATAAAQEDGLQQKSV